MRILSSLLFVFFALNSVFCQEDFEVPERLDIVSAPARKKHAITTEYQIAFNVGTGKEINKAWQDFLKKNYHFKVGGLGRNSHGDELMHSSWGLHVFNLESEVEMREGKETLVVLLYPVKEDRREENDNLLNEELHYLKTVLHDFAKQFYSDKMNEAIRFQEQAVQTDRDILESEHRTRRRIEKDISRSENRISRLERRRERLEPRILRMNRQIESGSRSKQQELQTVENKNRELEVQNDDICVSEDVLKQSTERLQQLQEKLRKIEAL